MMRLIVWLVWLLIAICCGLLIYVDPGYLLLGYRQWTVEMPLWLGILILFILWIVTSGIFNLLRTIWNFPHAWREYYVKSHQIKQATNQTLTLQKDVYVAMRNWEQLASLLPELQKRHLLKSEENLHLITEISNYFFQRDNQHATVEQIQTRWFALSRSLRKSSLLIASYTKLLLQYEKDKEAELLMRDHLNYSEKLLKHNTEDAVLLLALGRLCIQLQLWGKAKTYLEKSITLSPQPITYLELARLNEKLGHPAMTLNCYRDGLMLTVKQE